MNTNTSTRQRWIGATAIAAGLIVLLILGLQTQPIGAAVQDQQAQDLAYLFFAPESASDAAELIEMLVPDGRKIRFFGKDTAQPALVLQPILLVPDYSRLTPLLDSPGFIRLLRALEKFSSFSGAPHIRLWHPEGVILARKLGIKRLPAVAVQRIVTTSSRKRADVATIVTASTGSPADAATDGHWHVASGTRVDWSALFDCRGGK
jgi:hypothetical protein